MTVRIFLTLAASAVLLLVGCTPSAPTPEAPPVAQAHEPALPVEPIVEEPAPPPMPETGFSAFDAEAIKVASATGCRTGKTMRDPGLPALWGCIGGQQETVKLFMNEAEGAPDRVADVKLMWNDWTRDIGYGLHADSALARMWAEAVAKLYAPGQEAAVIKAFSSKAKATITSEEFVLTYTYEQGPSIGERLIVITERPK